MQGAPFCPGGMVPGAVPGAAQVQNPGVQVSLRAEGHMKLMALYLRQASVSRSVTPADISLDSIRTLRELREFESTYKVPTDNLSTIKRMGKTAVANNDDTARSIHSDTSEDRSKPTGSNRMNAARARKKKVSISKN